MFAFARRMLRDKWKSFTVYSISMIAFMEMYISLFPAISKQALQFDKMLKSFPPELFQAMNMDPSALSFSTLESYLSTEYMSFLWPIMAIIFAISIANYISVNEVDKGTIETLVSLPVSRTRIFIERYFTGLAILCIFCFISIFVAIPLAEFHNVKYTLDNYLTTTGGCLLLVSVVYSLATLSSVIFSEKSKATTVSGGILVFMYVLNVLSNLQDSLDNLKYVSFFHYFSGSDLLSKNVYPEYAVLVLGGVAIILFLAGLFWFNRRDLSV